MKKTLHRLLRETAGQDLAEYGMAIAVIGVVCAASAIMIARSTNTLWTRGMQTIVFAVLGG